MNKIIVVVLVLVIGFLSGCETLKGLGKDIENTGHNIQNALSGKPNQS